MIVEITVDLNLTLGEIKYGGAIKITGNTNASLIEKISLKKSFAISGSSSLRNHSSITA